MAVNAIGNEGINLLVVASAASDAFQPKGKRLEAETALWKHSLAVGLAAREIMSLLGLRGMEQGFICGLLHDIGKLLLFRHDLDTYQQLVKSARQQDFLAAEADVFGYTHAQVGALVARRWNLPDTICHAIYHHHRPVETEQSALMARVIEVADALANNAGLGVWPVSDRSIAEMESAIELRLSEHQLNDVWHKTEGALSATFALFN
jgi:putative nucleotidyltransferase with HDIG domain